MNKSNSRETTALSQELPDLLRARIESAQAAIAAFIEVHDTTIPEHHTILASLIRVRDEAHAKYDEAHAKYDEALFGHAARKATVTHDSQVPS